VNTSFLADENTSHHFVAACKRIEGGLPIVHISDWQGGAYLSVKDPALLMALRESKMILVGFDRASIPMHAGTLTREGLGHAGVILFRPSVPANAFGEQARLLVALWREACDWDWTDRIIYLPRNVPSFAVAESGAAYGRSFRRATLSPSAKAAVSMKRKKARTLVKVS
jgi:hypothetical protein